MALALRARSLRSASGPPLAFAFAILQTQSVSRTSKTGASPGMTKGTFINPITRHPGESRDPATFAEPGEMQSRWVPDIASRLCLQSLSRTRSGNCKRERRRRRVARASWMARVFRDDEQNQSFPEDLCGTARYDAVTIRSINSLIREASSGLTRCSSKPAAITRARSPGWP